MHTLKSILRRLGAMYDVPRKAASLEASVATMARNNLELARQIQELHRRLAYHERGPLAKSKSDLDQAREHGISNPKIIRV